MKRNEPVSLIRQRASRTQWQSQWQCNKEKNKNGQSSWRPKNIKSGRSSRSTEQRSKLVSSLARPLARLQGRHNGSIRSWELSRRSRLRLVGGKDSTLYGRSRARSALLLARLDLRLDLRTCLGERRARDTCCAINVAACVARKCKLTRAHPIRTEPNRTEMARAPVDLSRV